MNLYAWIELLGDFYDHYGYETVFLGALFENTALLGLVFPGGTLALLGAFYARQGTLSLSWVIALATLGTVLGYHVDYLLGRFVLDAPTTSTSTLERLSNRELEVFRLIGAGHSTRHIASVLHVSIKTVESHRAHIKEKLQLNDTGALVRYAMQWVDNGHVGID